MHILMGKIWWDWLAVFIESQVWKHMEAQKFWLTSCYQCWVTDDICSENFSEWVMWLIDVVFEYILSTLAFIPNNHFRNSSFNYSRHHLVTRLPLHKFETKEIQLRKGMTYIQTWWEGMEMAWVFPGQALFPGFLIEKGIIRRPK